MEDSGSVREALVGMRLSEVGWVAVAQAGVPLASVAGLALLTQFLSPHEYGVVAIVMSFVLAACSVALVPMSGPGAIFYQQWTGQGRTREYLWTLLTFNALCAGLLVAVGWALAGASGHALGAATFCGALLLAAETIKTPGVLLINLARRRGRYALLSLWDGWGKLLLALLALALIGASARSVLLAYAVNGALVACAGWWALLKAGSDDDGRPRCSATLLATLMKASGPFYGIGLANWVISVSDRALLGALRSSHEAGLYAASCQVAALFPMALYSFVGTLVWPIIYQRHAASPAEGTTLIGRSCGYLLWLLAPLIVVIILGREAWLALLAGPGYEAGAFVIWCVAPALACHTLLSITAMPFWLGKRGATYLVIVVVAAATNILLNLALIPRLGLAAAAGSTLTAYLLLLILSIVVGRRIIEWRVPAQHLWATALGLAGAGAAFMAAGQGGLWVRLGIFIVVYFGAGLAVLLSSDAATRAVLRSALARP